MHGQEKRETRQEVNRRRRQGARAARVYRVAFGGEVFEEFRLKTESGQGFRERWRVHQRLHQQKFSTYFKAHRTVKNDIAHQGLCYA